MSDFIKKFSVADIEIERDSENVDFAEVEIYAFGEGNNSHHNPISKEVLERDAFTFKGKFLTAKFDRFTQDTKGHETDEVIIGYVDPTSEIEFKTKETEDGEKEFVVVKGLLSKIYANDVYEMFKQNNERTVSCEFSCSTLYEEDENGTPLSENGVKMFGEDNPILGYNIHSITVLGLSYKPSIRGTEIKVKKFAENNFEQVLNKKDDDKKEEKMEDNKEFESTPNKEKEEDIVMEEKEKTSETQPLNNSEEEKEMKEKECSEEDNVEEKKEMSEENSEDEKKEMSEEEQKEEKDFVEDDKNKDDDESDDKDDDDKDEEEKEDKAFALKEFVTVSFENETDEVKEYVQEKVYSMSADEIINELVSLKKFEIAQNVKEKEFQLGQIMANVKEDLDEKTFSELKEEGLKLSLNELGGFENKVKAFAYESTKKNKKEDTEDGIMKFAGSVKKETINAEISADDIFNKYL